MTATTDFAVTVWPGIEPRLLRQGAEHYPDYRDSGGYRPLDDADGLLNQVDLSGILGRGGAAFPLAVKLKTVRDNGRTAGGAVVVANGEEGEPASIKDRWLLRNRPHLVLDGLRLAARLVSADRAHVYVSDRQCRRGGADRARRDRRGRPRRAVDHGVDGRPRLRRRRGDGRGARTERRSGQADRQAAAPVRRRRRPPSDDGEQCRDARPDPVHRTGTAPRCSAQQGTSTSPGTFLATITGAGRPPALYELPHGLAFGELLEFHGVPADQVHGVLMGGYFAGLLNTDVLDITLDHESVRRTRQRAGLRSDHDPHRGLSGGGRGVGDGVLRPRERGPVRLVLQRHRRHVGGDRGAPRRRGHQRGPGAAGAVVGGASRPRRLRDAGRRDERGRQPAVGVPASRRSTPEQRLRLVPQPARSRPTDRMRSRRW